MDPIYVTGHRNPDTDSIVSAIAYAALRNSLGDREFVAARLGHISDETHRILDRFDFQPPVLLRTMRTQVRDLDYDVPPALNAGVTIARAWEALQANHNVPGIPVTDEEGHLYGMVSPAEIADFDMEVTSGAQAERIPVFNLLSVLEGQILNETGNLVDAVSGEVTIALPQTRENLLFHGRDAIVICGDQPEMARRAMEEGVSCLIVCQAEFPEELRKIPTRTCIISTPFDAVRTARLIYHAIPVDRICRREGLECFHLEDFLDDVQEVVSKSRHRNYPILDENEKVVGTLSRFHLLRPRRKRVVLVDHNEAAQSVPGLNQAEIVEIVDHHRLADIQTSQPIYFRNEVVGSTATIIAGMYQEKGLMPSSKLAGLLAAAIVSDTVIFKSPTCTERDHRMAERMARIAGLKLDELGQFIFAESSNFSKPADELILTDFKDFHIAEHYLGVSQITCVDSEKLMTRQGEFLSVMEKLMEERSYSMMILMLTDVLAEGSHLLYLGDEEIFHQAFNTELKNHACFLPGVVSRKKQVIPMLTALWG
ncbi:MAG TPA: putative manganese-dependent inorganic diphosphatase [Candidatus Avoscillospira avicola]|uniref:inorganic diphosphatase n=1 Tax=Candidatus Avoscillospira avicola TaxID=2840706 RepID=A0A9D1DHW0_9FIRM|nr:putative manganese-dependent inorganic diphosphatase [Candidatus Avoscillospira avicola]